MILGGKRKLTVRNIHAFAHALKLSPPQTEVFEALVLRDQASSETERVYYGRRLKSKTAEYGLRDVRSPGSLALGAWFVPALLIYLRERGYDLPKLEASGELPLIAARIGLPPETLRRWVHRLDRDGQLCGDAQAGEHLVFDKATTALAQMEYVRKCLGAALRKVESDYPNGRSLFSVKTVSLSSEKLAEFTGRYKALVDHYMRADEQSLPKDRTVFQVVFSALRTL